MVATISAAVTSLIAIDGRKFTLSLLLLVALWAVAYLKAVALLEAVVHLEVVVHLEAVALLGLL